MITAIKRPVREKHAYEIFNKIDEKYSLRIIREIARAFIPTYDSIKSISNSNTNVTCYANEIINIRTVERFLKNHADNESLKNITFRFREIGDIEISV